MRSRLLLVATVLVAGIAVLACSSPAASTVSQAPASVAPATVAPSTAASDAPSTAPSAAPSSAAAATVEAKPVGSIGTVLVAGSNGLTVYTFTKDTKDSGTSACTGGCISTWPALTVDAGATPVAGSGVTGKLGTITRADDGTLQVTYNGMPLYFFKNDKAPGDANGVYENWEAVKP
jgi:predicted lipoprotein with Yx(FWY)xxD motif